MGSAPGTAPLHQTVASASPPTVHGVRSTHWCGGRECYIALSPHISPGGTCAASKFLLRRNLYQTPKGRGLIGRALLAGPAGSAGRCLSGECVRSAGQPTLPRGVKSRKTFRDWYYLPGLLPFPSTARAVVGEASCKEAARPQNICDFGAEAVLKQARSHGGFHINPTNNNPCKNTASH